MPPRISNPLDASKIDVAILCGGLGTRLKNVINDRPKSMAEINGTPFLDLLIDHIAKFGFKHFILCTGHMGETIENRYAGKKPAINIEISREIQPLGTGGALKNGSQLITSNPFLVVNGDSFCAVDLKIWQGV